MNTVQIKDLPLSTQLTGTEDIMISTASGTSKRIKSSLIMNAGGSDGYNADTRQIDTGDFFPPATNMFPFFKTPGSYGVVFNDQPIAGLNETNFNLKVDYVSHDGSGGNGNQDILQTLTTKDGVSYTRRLYHVGQQADMSATDFKTVGSGGSSSGNSTISSIISATPPEKPSNGDHWTSTVTYIDYTYVGAWIEL